MDFDKLVERVEAILDPISNIQPECGETTKLSFPTLNSSAVEPPDLISKRKWVGPIHVWLRWPSLTIGRKRTTSGSPLEFR